MEHETMTIEQIEIFNDDLIDVLSRELYLQTKGDFEEIADRLVFVLEGDGPRRLGEPTTISEIRGDEYVEATDLIEDGALVDEIVLSPDEEPATVVVV